MSPVLTITLDREERGMCYQVKIEAWIDSNLDMQTKVLHDVPATGWKQQPDGSRYPEPLPEVYFHRQGSELILKDWEFDDIESKINALQRDLDLNESNMSVFRAASEV